MARGNVARIQPWYLTSALVAGSLFVGCGGGGDETNAQRTWSVTVADNITGRGPTLLPVGSASASSSYPVATVQSREIPPQASEILVRVQAVPRKPIGGSYTVRCYGQGGSEIRSREIKLAGTPPVRSSATPTVSDPEYCQADGQVSYAGNFGGRIEMMVLARLPGR